MLTIEDGSGVTGADSFITLEEFSALVFSYFAQEMTESDNLEQAALRRVWVYLKSLSWKVDYPFPTLGGTIPADVKTAQAVLAFYELRNPNALQPNVVPGQQKVLTRVGELGWTSLAQGGTNAQRAVVTMAADLLKPFVNDTGSTRFLLRG